MLANLIAGTMPPGLELMLGTGDPVAADEIIVQAQDVCMSERLGTDLIIWGKVSGHTRTKWDGLMIRLQDAADDVAILVDKKNLARLRLTDADTLTGRHVFVDGGEDASGVHCGGGFGDLGLRACRSAPHSHRAGV
jgi:hypothetical protein